MDAAAFNPRASLLLLPSEVLQIIAAQPCLSNPKTTSSVFQHHHLQTRPVSLHALGHPLYSSCRTARQALLPLISSSRIRLQSLDPEENDPNVEIDVAHARRQLSGFPRAAVLRRLHLTVGCMLPGGLTEFLWLGRHRLAAVRELSIMWEMREGLALHGNCSSIAHVCPSLRKLRLDRGAARLGGLEPLVMLSGLRELRLGFVPNDKDMPAGLRALFCLTGLSTLEMVLDSDGRLELSALLPGLSTSLRNLSALTLWRRNGLPSEEKLPHLSSLSALTKLTRLKLAAEPETRCILAKPVLDAICCVTQLVDLQLPDHVLESNEELRCLLSMPRLKSLCVRGMRLTEILDASSSSLETFEVGYLGAKPLQLLFWLPLGLSVKTLIIHSTHIHWDLGAVRNAEEMVAVAGRVGAASGAVAQLLSKAAPGSGGRAVSKMRLAWRRRPSHSSYGMAKVIAGLFLVSPRVLRLSLIKWAMDEEEVLQLQTAFPQLQMLCLIQCRVTEAAWLRLLPCLPHLSSLRVASSIVDTTLMELALAALKAGRDIAINVYHIFVSPTMMKMAPVASRGRSGGSRPQEPHAGRFFSASGWQWLFASRQPAQPGAPEVRPAIPERLMHPHEALEAAQQALKKLKRETGSAARVSLEAWFDLLHLLPYEDGSGEEDQPEEEEEEEEEELDHQTEEGQVWELQSEEELSEEEELQSSDEGDESDQED